jgi:AcrR family transcriptional regulator
MDIRDKLLDAAARVYAEHGYRGATTRRIAQEAGVNEITLFRHFGSKDALILEAVRHCGEPISLPELPEIPVDPQRELAEWASQHHATLYERRSLIRTCMGEMAERPEVGLQATEGPVRAAHYLSAYFARLRDHGFTTAEFDPSVPAWMLLACIFADAMWRDVMGEQMLRETDDAFAVCAGVVLRGIGVAAQSRARPGRAAEPGADPAGAGEAAVKSRRARRRSA